MRCLPCPWGCVASSSILILFSLLIGCGKAGQINTTNGSAPSDPPGSGYAPAGTFGVIAINPAPGATNVQSTAIQITFSSALDLSTVNPTTIQLTDPGSSVVAGSLGYSAGSMIVTFTIATPLEIGTTYTVTVSGVKSSAGAAMASTFTSTFATPPPPQPVPAPVTSCPIGTGPDVRGFADALQGCIQYQSSLFSSTSSMVNDGGIAMDTSGNMVINLYSSTNPVPANSEFTVQFCPAYNSSYSAEVPACFDVGVVSSDSSGYVNSIIKFPRSGSWAGDFRMLSGNTVVFQTTAVQNNSDGAGFPFIVFAETLQPESTVNGMGVAHGLEPDPLTNGAFYYQTIADLWVYLNGASMNTYVIYESQNLDVGCLCANQVSTFTTDTNPADPDVYTRLSGGDIFTIEPQDKAHAGWIGGFSVP